MAERGRRRVLGGRRVGLLVVFPGHGLGGVLLASVLQAPRFLRQVAGGLEIVEPEGGGLVLGQQFLQQLLGLVALDQGGGQFLGRPSRAWRLAGLGLWHGGRVGRFGRWLRGRWRRTEHGVRRVDRTGLGQGWLNHVQSGDLAGAVGERLDGDGVR